MELHGRSTLGLELAEADGTTFFAVNPTTSQQLEPRFYEATKDDVEKAFLLAEHAFDELRQKPREEIARFLDSIAAHIMSLGDALIERANAETGLPIQRLISERGRTVSQLRMFADVVREGSWVEAIIERAEPERKPLPKPDLRRMLIPTGPVVVFGASNFPLAFSVAGGDTASALAAGNPVIVKAHPAHPGTSELVARAIVRAAEESGMPAGVFSLLQGTSPELSLDLVRHPSAAAVGFTGSLKAGRALFDAAAARPRPIPVYAEMGSVNPVFVLPRALSESGDALAQGLQQSMTLGVGQFCTSPGLVVGLKQRAMDNFIDRLCELIRNTPPGTMLHAGILCSYQDGLSRQRAISQTMVQRSTASPDETRTEGAANMLVTNARTFFEYGELSEEVFGPSTVVAVCNTRDEMMRIACNLEGHLTATILGTDADLEEYSELVMVLQNKVGRMVFNGFPTGVEVSAAMHHGGPYPATTDSKTTSVGSAAIKRFARPVCFQNAPQAALPVELQDKNERGIWRMVDGVLSNEMLDPD